MDVRANAIANTFLIPQINSALPQQRSIANRSGLRGGGPEVPDPVEGLQYVENTTRDYYDKWANLKSFVNTAWSNFGIDVTKPDFSKPESIQMNEIYNKAVADLMFQGDQLKTSQGELSKILADRRKGNVILNQDPSQGLVTQTDPRALSTSTAADPITEETNEFSKRRFFTNKEFGQATEAYEQTKQMWESQIQADPDNAAYYQRQIELLEPPTKSTKIFAPKDKKDSGTGQAGGSLLKKVSNVLLGSGETWSRATLIDPTKLQNIDFRGDAFGDFINQDGRKIAKVIDTILFDPESGQTTIVYQGDEVPDETYSSNDALSFTRQLVSSNSKYGSLTSLDKYIENNSLLDEEGEVDSRKLVSPRMAKLQEANIKEIKELKPYVEQAKDNFKSKLEDLSSYGAFTYFNERGSFILPQGQELRILKEGKGYTIDNIKDFFPDKKSSELKMFEETSLENIINFLTTTGLLEQEAQKLKEAGTKDVPSTSEFDEDI